MHFHLHPIENKMLQPLVKYILFNQSRDPSDQTRVISYANHNICLGIIKDKKLDKTPAGEIISSVSNGISSYLSGMYLPPHRFVNRGIFDEICIDFSPQGFFHFSRMPVQTYLFDGDPLTEILQKGAKDFFEKVFSYSDYNIRGRLIESYLYKLQMNFSDPFMETALQLIHQKSGDINLYSLKQKLNCSENKLLRSFKSRFDLTPKEYIRIVRFRHSLKLLYSTRMENLTDIAYQCGYYDQSHFIKEYQFFTNASPKIIRDNLTSIQEQVMVSIH